MRQQRLQLSHHDATKPHVKKFQGNLICSPQVPEVSRLLDERRQPDAGLSDVGGEAALVVDRNSLHVQPKDQLVLAEL